MGGGGGSCERGWGAEGRVRGGGGGVLYEGWRQKREKAADVLFKFNGQIL